MKLISCHDGKLHALESSGEMLPGGPSDKAFRTGLAALDTLPPGGAFARGAVHELLAAPTDGQPLFFAAVLARAAGCRDKGTRRQEDTGTARLAASFSLSPGPLVPLSPFSSALIWSDPAGELYPPALAALGIPLERVFLLRPGGEADQVWAIAECLRCRGVAAVVAAAPARLSRVEARRLQLAAERGGGVGLLLRTAGRTSDGEHAAVTRWLVRPEPGGRDVQRWRIQLIFGHGGRVGQSVVLEHHRDPQPLSTTTAAAPRIAAHPVRPAAELADRSAVPSAGRAAG